MDDILKEKQKVRFDFLNKLYEISGGHTDELTDGNNVAKELGLHNNFEKLKSVVNYLKGEYLIEDANIMCSHPLGILKITHKGITEIERAISAPERPTEYFAPINILHMIPQNITIHNSSGVQIGNHNSQTTTVITQENTELFKNIENTIINEISDTNNQKLILSKLKDLEQSIGSPNYFSKYQEFIGVAANYMTVLAPFIPALTTLAK